MAESDPSDRRGPARRTERETTAPRPVLCVDDDETNRYVRTRALTAAGFEVIEAATGRDALDLAVEHQPALVLLDIRLPDIDGFAVCERLKSDGRTRRIPVLHVSAQGRMESDLPESLMHRSDAYLREPIEPETLVGTVAALIRAREAERRERQAEARAAFERRRTQRELAFANRRLERVLAAITEGSYVLDAEWRFTRVNPAAEQHFGQRAAELVGHSIWDVTSVREGLFWDKFHEAAASGRPTHFEAPSLVRAGFWADLHLHPAAGGLEVYFRDISARKRVEEELQRQREWLRVTLGSIGEAVIASDAAGTIQFLNGVAANLTGWTQQEALGQPLDHVFRAIRAEVRNEAADLFARVLCERRAVGVGEDTILISRDGREIPIEDRAAPIQDSAGNVLGVVLAFHDVTEERRAQEALRENERRYRELVQNANSAIVRWKQDGTLTFFNEYAEQFFGYSSDEVVGKHVGFLLPETESTGADLTNLVGEIVAAPERFATFVNENLCRDGRRVWMAWTNKPIFDKGGRVSEVLAVGTDVTERKRAEEKVRQRNAVLESINRIFAAALECDTEERLGAECLKVAEELTQSRFGFLGELGPTGRLDHIAISDAGWDACRMDLPRGNRTLPHGLEIHGLYGPVIALGKGYFTNDPATHPDSIGAPPGHPALQAFLGVPLKHGGKVIGMIAVGNREGGYSEQDLESLEALAPSVVQVLMRQKAEHAVQAGEERLRQAQKMESIGLLAGGVAHDFNNLLTGILGNASLVIDDVEPAVAERLTEIIKSAERAAQLTRQLLAYSGKGQFVVRDIDVSTAVHDIADLVQFSIPKSVELSIAVQRRLPAVRMDPSQFQQVLMNLVINAGEAIGEGNPGKLIVATTMTDVEKPFVDALGQEVGPGRYVCIEVSDTGSGIGEEQRAKIFDPFFTTKFAGRGLGLAAVAGIIRSQGGAITLDSAPENGTTFRVFLPAAAEGAAPKHGGSPEAAAKATVLIVDDEGIVREFLAAALRKRGYHVLTASDGREALAASKNGRVDAAIVDLVMPVMGANELVSLLREQQPEARILLTSGYSESEARRLCAAYPDAAFVQKPYTALQLVKALEGLLTAKRGAVP